MQVTSLCSIQEFQHLEHGCPANLKYMVQVCFMVPDHCELYLAAPTNVSTTKMEGMVYLRQPRADMYQDTYLLIVLRGNLLQKVRNALPLWAGKATRLKELHNMLPWTMKDNTPYTQPSCSTKCHADTDVLQQGACRICKHQDEVLSADSDQSQLC